MSLGIYIHIPFCKQKCFYCDFYSKTNCNNVEEYIDSVINEILSHAELLQNGNIETIYIGGGTPSLISEKYIIKILDVLKLLSVDVKEITIEVNPENVTYEKLKAYYDTGVNRLSIGLQSANDATLKKIGRMSTTKQFENAINLASKVGFKNISCDVIMGLCDESLDDFKHTIDYVLSFKEITHISSYSLEVHENTKLDFLITNGFVSLPDEQEERNMKYLLDRKLEAAGFVRYEISNYAKPGFESKHNLRYWNGEEYLGFGAAAASYINSTRYTNVSNIDTYIHNISKGLSTKENIEEMDKLDLIKEYIILRLRLKAGVNFNDFKLRFKIDINELFKDKIDLLETQGLIVKTNNCIYLSNKGEDVANIVWQEFI